MTTKDEALNKAIRALSAVDETFDLRGYSYAPPNTNLLDITLEAITACREALAQPAGERGEFIDRSDAVNLARNMMEIHDCKGITEKGVRVLCDAVLRMDAALRGEGEEK